MSGALSGFASTIILQPFDLLKTRIQQPDHLNKLKPSLSPQSTLVFRTARDIVQSKGFLGLWRGTTASLLRNVPGVALYFTGLNQFRAFLATSPYFAPLRAPSASSYSTSTLPKLTPQGNLLAGAVTRVAVGFLLNPISVLKARYESSLYTYNSLPQALMGIMRSGPSEVFRGAVASSLRDAPYAGIFVVFYEHIKNTMSNAVSSAPNAAGLPIPISTSAAVNSVSAASAGALATLATQPFDVLKTKMQVRSEIKYRGLLSTVSAIWRGSEVLNIVGVQQRGIAGFFDGATLRMSRKIFSSAIGWAVYEGVLVAMRSEEA
ncbi:Solute carrier family 25 member 38 -like protein [Trametes pubescens]|uniref:Solute carrier family 25 member 38-like protein n=1 Tax=Trametes pubescens TaxID=154538 RepID=A0A1M2VQ46_TRAPU|nr:Solute carrier family 25 member 38 -like protein [Trametes pubescens]